VQAADAAVESAVSEEAGVLAGHVQWLPRRVLRDVIVAALACGMDHSVAVAGGHKPFPYPDPGKLNLGAKVRAKLTPS
jgi:hypothetical protein